jgi:spore coat protein U-like protein
MVTLSATLAPAAARDLRETTGLGVTLLDYALRTNRRSIVNWREPTSTDAAAGFGSGSKSLLAIHGQSPAAQCTMPGTCPDTMIVVVTY